MEGTYSQSVWLWRWSSVWGRWVCQPATRRVSGVQRSSVAPPSAQYNTSPGDDHPTADTLTAGCLENTHHIIQIIKRYEGLDERAFFKRQESVTRGHSLKLYKMRVNKDVFKFSFGHRVIDEWNKLPEEVINAEGINLFKTIVDKFLRNKWGSLWALLSPRHTGVAMVFTR